jgi:hypothetical protein
MQAVPASAAALLFCTLSAHMLPTYKTAASTSALVYPHDVLAVPVVLRLVYTAVFDRLSRNDTAAPALRSAGTA